MPAIGYRSKNLTLARAMLEHCRFAYKMYAQTCRYPLDPFFESDGHGPRDAVMAAVRKALGTTRAPFDRFDPIEYILDRTPDPRRGVVYRKAVDDGYILFQPRPLDLGIGHARGFDLAGAPVDDGIAIDPAGTRCCYFQGCTGMTQDAPEAGWPSWLGAVFFDRDTGTCVIAFRGSRSGSGARSLFQAELEDCGSPDWVTDMQQYKKSAAIPHYNDATLSCGFHLAYESCRPSLLAAFREALDGAVPRAILVTGHSLGGALAQCGYLDFALGLHERVADGVPVSCYPISAPPIVLGRESHWKLALAIDATQIHHYFCRHDVVHGGALCGTPSALFGEMQATHEPFHIGAELALESSAEFPAAHDPGEVWSGMNAGASDVGFWPSFRFNHVTGSSPFFTDLPPELEAHLAAALRSPPDDLTGERVKRWLDVLGDHAQLHGELSDALSHAVQPGIGAAPVEALEAVRREVLAKYLKATSTGLLHAASDALFGGSAHHATASGYWVLLQYLTANLVGQASPAA
jgi:hypothetical protein